MQWTASSTSWWTAQCQALFQCGPLPLPFLPCIYPSCTTFSRRDRRITFWSFSLLIFFHWFPLESCCYHYTNPQHLLSNCQIFLILWILPKRVSSWERFLRPSSSSLTLYRRECPSDHRDHRASREQCKLLCQRYVCSSLARMRLRDGLCLGTHMVLSHEEPLRRSFRWLRYAHPNGTTADLIS